MSDCGNAVVRDQLPEFVHSLLPATDRAVIEAHLADCDDCRAEVELLRTVQRAWAPADATSPDVAAIVRALPRPPALAPRLSLAEPGRADPKRPARRFASARWQLAAAALVIVAASLAMTIASRTDRGAGRSEFLIVATPGSERAPASPDSAALGVAAIPDTPSGAAPDDSVLLATTTADEATISFGGGVDDLETSELETLMQAIDEIDGRPAAEPATPASIPIELRDGAIE